MKVPIACKVCKHIRSIPDAAGPDENPCKRRQGERCCQHDRSTRGSKFRQADGGEEPVSPLLGEKTADQVRSVQNSPNHVSPIGYVPEAAQTKCDQQIYDVPATAYPIAAQRNIQIILEPGRQ